MRVLRREAYTTALQLAQALDLLQGQLQQLLLLDDVKVPPDTGVLAGEALHLRVGEVPAESHVQLAGEVVVEFREELHVEEEDGGGGELVRDHVEEDLWAVVFVLLVGALLGANGHESHLDDIGSVTEEDGFPACVLLV